MSVSGAIAELNKEIERLTKIRDSLLQVPAETRSPGRKRTTAPNPVAVKKTTKKAAKTGVPAPAKKRVLSAAGRKRISDAAKARWAAAKKTSK